ncbi:hypothetical protein BDN67DRAFT_983331 [Paxillus ammoniavirescens]|nr:hypothetical protein BDN67DRAFT_983331 [Paxillus ammoniavirescens]
MSRFPLAFDAKRGSASPLVLDDSALELNGTNDSRDAQDQGSAPWRFLYGARSRHTSREQEVVAFKETDSIGKLNWSPNEIQIYASEDSTSMGRKVQSVASCPSMRPPRRSIIHTGPVMFTVTPNGMAITARNREETAKKRLERPCDMEMHA